MKSKAALYKLLVLCCISCGVVLSAVGSNLISVDKNDIKRTPADSISYEINLKLVEWYGVGFGILNCSEDRLPVVILDDILLNDAQRAYLLDGRKYDDVVSIKAVKTDGNEIAEYIEKYGEDAANGVVWVTTAHSNRMTEAEQEIPYESVAAIYIDGERADFSQLVEFDWDMIRELFITRAKRDVYGVYNCPESMAVVDINTRSDSDQVDGQPGFFANIFRMPSFGNGSLESFRVWVSNKIWYPAFASESGLTGKVVVQFVVDKDGSIIIDKIKESPDESLTNVVLSVIKSSPRWTPGLLNGKYAMTKFTLPVIFNLD